MKIHRVLQVSLIGVVALAMLSCARVRVEKIPSPTQYLQWTDEMQAAADRISGVRFYLARPFVNVFESFPIRTDLYFATGTVTPDGKYVVIGKVYRPDGTAVAAFTDVEIRKRKIFRPDGLRQLIESQSATEDEPQPPRPAPTPEEPQPKKPPESEDRQGVKELRVTNDPSAFSYQPMRGNLDLVYVPDFEEQYALRVKGGLGRARATMALGQGWSLQGLEATADNSALAERLFGLIDRATDLAFNAAKAAAGVPSIPGVTSAIEPQSAAEAEDGTPGTPVTLKITVLHYAAKGLYPVLKPREIQPRTMLGTTGTQMTVPYIVTADLTAAQRTKDFHTSIADIGTFTIPVYPYQYVSFNTFRYIAIEAIRPDTPFVGLYGETGTAGDPGDRLPANLDGLLSNQTGEQGAQLSADNLRIQLEKISSEVQADLAENPDLTGFSIAKVDLLENGTAIEPTITLSRRGDDEAKFKQVARTAIANLVRDIDPKLSVEDIRLVDE